MSPDVLSFAVHRLVFLLPVLPLLLAPRNLTGFSLSIETVCFSLDGVSIWKYLFCFWITLCGPKYGASSGF